LFLLPDIARRNRGAPSRRRHQTLLAVKKNSVTAPIADKLKALLAISGKVQKNGKQVLSEDIVKALQKGATAWVRWRLRIWKAIGAEPHRSLREGTDESRQVSVSVRLRAFPQS
jgi:hypothetical protein